MWQITRLNKIQMNDAIATNTIQIKWLNSFAIFLISSHFAILAAIFGFNSVNLLVNRQFFDWPINRLSAPIPIINAAASVKQMCFYSLYSRLSNNKVSPRHRTILRYTKTTESPTVSSRRQTTVSLYCAVQSRSPNRRRTTIEKVQSSVRDGTEHAHFLLITSNRPVSRKLKLTSS